MFQNLKTIKENFNKNDEELFLRVLPDTVGSFSVFSGVVGLATLSLIAPNVILGLFILKLEKSSEINKSRHQGLKVELRVDQPSPDNFSQSSG